MRISFERSLLPFVLIVSIIAVTATPATAAQGDTILVSRVGEFGPGGDGSSFTGALSTDGNFFAFVSDANNLSADDNDAFMNVFLRDLALGTTKLVSLPSGTSGATNNNNSHSPSVSADGRYVAFTSGSDSMSPIDNNSVDNIFVRDMWQNATILVSRPTGGDGVANTAGALNPRISADGRHVVFTSAASNLAPAEDGNVFADIFVRDLATNTTTLVSRPTGAANAAGNNSLSGAFTNAISATGRYIAFDSDSDNLSTEDNNAFHSMFLRDVQLGTTILVSRPTTGSASGTEGAFTPSISADGRFVSFDSHSATLTTDDNDAQTDVFLRDTVEGTTTLISRPTGQTGAGNDNYSFNRGVSDDGRYVLFDSAANNMSSEDNDAFDSVFVRDVQAETTTLVSRPTGTTGATNNGQSFGGVLSGDGRFAGFSSGSSNMSPDDDNTVFNVHAHDLLGPQAPPDLEINNVSGRERNSGTSAFTFTVTLDGVFGRTVTVDFATKNGTATRGSDYAFTNGTLTFAPGELSKTIAVNVNGDRLRERTETFKVRLFNNSGAEISDATGIGTIKNDERK